MNGFAQNLSILRKEKGLSQRQAAEELHISQALLSHYENGIREPRLDFVIKACEYYGVSADFILGRTAVPENFTAGPDSSQTPSTIDRYVSMLSSSLAAIFRLLEDMGDEKLLQEAAYYIGIPSYKLFRMIENFRNGNIDTLPKNLIFENALSDAASKLTITNFSDRLRELLINGSGGGISELTVDSLKERFNQAYSVCEELFSYVCARLSSVVIL